MFEDFESAIDKTNAFYKKGTPFFVALDYEMKRAIFLGGDDIFKRADTVKFKVGNFTNAPIPLCTRVSKTPSIAAPHPVPAELSDAAEKQYEQKFAKVRRALLNGDTFLANLCARSEIDFHASLEDAFYSAESEYALCVKDAFACFSPECFVKTIGRKIFSYPMKGTIDASVADAEKTLLEDEKELREHNTIVDLIRNDLAAIADNVRVEKFRFCSRIPRRGKSSIIQTSSQITGILKPLQFGDALAKMLPAGSICGAPKTRTLEVLRDAEGLERGFYTGIFGYFDSRNFDSAVAIRFLEKDAGKTYFRSGGGITALSDAHSEFLETREKIYIPIPETANTPPRFLETIKVADGKMKNWDSHTKRISFTLAKFYPQTAQTAAAKIEAEILQAAKKAESASLGKTFKLRVEYSDKPEKIELLPYAPKKIKTLKLVFDNDIFYAYKFADRSALERLRNLRGGCDDIIICKNGLITDSSYANLVFVKDGKFFTPSAPLLDGTKRKTLVESGIAAPAEIRPRDLRKFERVVFVNAMLDISDNVGADTDKIFGNF